MPIHPFDNRPFALGLQWAFASDRAELAVLLRRDGAAVSVAVPTEDGLLYGQPPADSPSAGATRCAGVPAAALVVGQLQPDAVVHHPLDARRIWFCAVRDGLPLPGNDRICTPEEAQEALDNILRYQPNTALVGNLPNAVASLPELLARADAASLRRAGLRATRRPRWPWMVGGFVATGALLAWLLVPTPQAVAPLAPPMADVPSVDRAALQQAHAKEIARVVAEGREEMRNQPPFGATAREWLDTMRDLPLAVAAYRPRQLECRPAECLASWDWAAASFDDQALARLPGVRVPGANPSEYAQRAQTRLALAPIERQPLTLLQADDLEPTLVRLAATLGRYGARADIGKADGPISVTLPATPPELRSKGSSQTASASQTRVIGHQGRVRVMVSGWSHVQAVLGELANYPLVAERAVFTVNQSVVNLQLEARYVVPAKD